MKSLLAKRSEIHLGDLMEALSQLSLQNESQAEKIAKSLGFESKELLDQQHQLKKSRSAHNQQVTRASQTDKSPIESNLPVTTPLQPRPSIALPRETISEPLKQKDDLLPMPATELAQPSPNEAFNYYDKRLFKPERHQSIFSQGTSRGIFIALLQTSRYNNSLDLAKLIRLIAHGLPPKQLPYCREGTLQHGCQLLLDYGETMAPWKNDLKNIAMEIETVVGKSSVTTYRFKDNPDTAAHRSRHIKPRPWKPRSQVPVLVATDFGLPLMQSKFRIQENWKDIVKCCEKTSSPLIFLVPWEFDTELEKTLGPYPYFFPWSPKTSSSLIKSFIGNGHKTRA
jgi:hypothetical protein